MNQKLTSPLLWTAVVGVLKILLDPIGIQLPSDKLDSMANGIAAMFVIIGIVWDHGLKPSKPITLDEILDAITNLVSEVKPVVTPEVTQPVSSVAPQPDKILEDQQTS